MIHVSPAPRRRQLFAVALAGLILSFSSARATTLRRMELADLVASADRVVYARVVDQKVYWDPTGTQIFTDTLFEVLEEAKGHGPRQLTVIMHGGRIDPVEISSPGTPTFVVGQEEVLFTTARPDGKKNLAGFSQGRMQVVQDEAGNRSAVSSVPAGVTFVELREGRPVRTSARPGRLPLEDLLNQVRQLVASGRAASPQGARKPQRVDVAPDERGQR